MSRATGHCNLEAQVEALRRQLAEVIVTLGNASRRLEDLADELRLRRHADKVVMLDRHRPGKGGHDLDILNDFLE
jgi:hypothetical protein